MIAIIEKAIDALLMIRPRSKTGRMLLRALCEIAALICLSISGYHVCRLGEEEGPFMPFLMASIAFILRWKKLESGGLRVSLTHSGVES